MHMKELAAENIRLRGLVSNLFERLRDPAEKQLSPSAAPPIVSPGADKERKQKQAIRSAAEKCGGALTGRFASLRVHP
jgi:putative transposase